MLYIKGPNIDVMKQFLLGLAMLTAAHMWGQTPDMYCGPGTVWDDANQLCVVALPSDANLDGCVQLADLLGLLGAYGNCGVVEGCTNELACNFLAEANEDDGSCILVGSSCDDGDATTTGDQIQADCTCAGEPALQVGNYHEGGVIAYLFQPGDPGYSSSVVHGIILSVHELPAGISACFSSNAPSIGALMGGAQYNTETIMIYETCPSYQDPAAQKSLDYENDGFDDWYLPTWDELVEISNNRSIINNAISAFGLGQTLHYDYHWSSNTSMSGDSPYQTYAVRLSSGYLQLMSNNTGNRIRAIRYF